MSESANPAPGRAETPSDDREHSEAGSTSSERSETKFSTASERPAPRKRRAKKTVRKKRRPGPTKLTREVQAAIVAHIANGVTKEAAAKAVGIDPATLFRAQARIRGFGAAIARAEDELRPKLCAVVVSAALAGDWRAAIAMLERLWPEDYSKRLKIGGDPHNAAPVPIDAGAEMRELAKRMAGMTTEELRAFAPIRKPHDPLDRPQKLLGFGPGVLASSTLR